ncbi:hypothetical protein SESBI_23152 [Sesbania bispinosa]|nr:hypothetical protein SESBI_23152 [Sesbania bispinosa]
MEAHATHIHLLSFGRWKLGELEDASRKIKKLGERKREENEGMKERNEEE